MFQLKPHEKTQQKHRGGGGDAYLFCLDFLKNIVSKMVPLKTGKRFVSMFF